jgi:hypothetical protein
VAGSCKYGDEPSGSGAMELVRTVDFLSEDLVLSTLTLFACLRMVEVTIVLLSLMSAAVICCKLHSFLYNERTCWFIVQEVIRR